MGVVRRLWRSILALTTQDLRLVARTLGVKFPVRSGEELRDRLNDHPRRCYARFGVEAGFYLRRFDSQASCTRQEGFRLRFPRHVRAGEIASGRTVRAIRLPVGVRSFMHPIDDLEARSTRRLIWCPTSMDALSATSKHGTKKLFPDLRSFHVNATRTNYQLRVYPRHACLACLRGRRITLCEVRQGGRNRAAHRRPPLFGRDSSGRHPELADTFS